MATITTQERTNILKLVAGMFNAAPGANYLNEFTASYQALGNNLSSLATALGNTGAFKSLYPSTLTSTEFATKFLTTLGLQANTEAAAWVQAKVNAGASFSSVILQAVAALDATSDAQFATAKALLANKASVAEYYSVPSPVGVGVSSDNLATLQTVFSKVTSDAASVQVAKDAIVGGGNGQSFTLTTAQDVFNGTAGADIIRGVAGQAVGNQDQSTFNSSDIIDGGNGEDKLVINMTGANYAGGATVKSVETLQIGSNLAAATFDYNVNQGAYEINGTNVVIYDQITVGETLTVNNLTPTATTANPIPVLSWENEAGSLAGVAAVTYRQATITGTSDNQVVNLKNVNNGVLNIGAGIETLTINSQGTAARNTLLNASAGAGIDTGNNAVAADLGSSGSLTKVVINATTELGKVGGRVATTGLTDRVATDGVGDGLTTTAANLLSVGARVTNVDANASTAAVNVQFVAKTDGTPTPVTFTGGKGNDYAEFEVGNVTAIGGEGNDTFAFITQRAGVTNSTFGAGDSIVGGAGTDTIQIGSNGVGTYTIADSEWANKSGIEVVDLRGATNGVTLSSTFVAATDAGVKLTVTSDNIVVGGTAPSNNEYNAVSTVDLRTLSAGQGIKFVGGQGSDRLILSDTTFTSNMELAGGSNVDNAGNAATAHYDTLNVSNSAVLDRTDLANVSGFEGLVLSKTVTGTVTDVIELTEAFLLANTAATNSTTTTIDDRIFQIGTTASANGTALAAGDTVRIDVTDLFTVNNNTVKSTVVGRQIDVTSLTNAGVAVQYVYNGTTYANLAALTAAVATVGGNAVLNGADANFAHVIVDSAANGAPAAVGRTLVFTGTSGNTTSGFEVQGAQLATAQDDTINVGALTLLAASVINGSGGTNTLVVRDGANISAATLANVTQLTFDATGVAGTNDLTLTAAQHAAFSGTVTAAGTGTAGENIIGSAAGAFGTALSGVENYNLVGGSSIAVNSATLGVNVTSSNAAASTVTVGGNAVTGTYALAHTADVLVATTGANITGVNAGALTTAESLTLTGTVTMTAAQYGDGSTTGLTTNAITAAGGTDQVNISNVFNSAIGANATAVEKIVLQATGNDQANITTGVAGSFLGTVDIAAGGQDTITLTNAAHNGATSNFATIAGFTAAAGANMDVLRVVQAGTAISGPLTAINAGSNTNYAGATNSVIEIENGGVLTLTDVANAGAVETLIMAAIGNIAAGDYTVVVYGGSGNSNAGIYSMNITGANIAAATDFTVELVGVVEGVGANNLTGANFSL